jgi:tRNA uracil 4-sulfurtransferase
MRAKRARGASLTRVTVAKTSAERILSAARTGAGTPCVLLRFGELSLKGRKRPLFAAALERNLRRAASGAGAAPIELARDGSTLVASAPVDRFEALIAAALDVPGLSVVQPALRVEPTAEAAARAAVALLRGRPGHSFAIRSRRRDKRFPMRSVDMARIVGRAVQEELGLSVDLDAPELEVHVDSRLHDVFVSAERLRGAGGLPVGTSGRAMVLLSGGIDSPVAAYRMMRRGLRCDFVHFSGQPLTGPESAYKAYALVARLARFQGRSRLFVVPIGMAQRLLATSGAGGLQVLAQRRLMVRIAASLATREGCHALVTGDSLGQVASQTLRNLEVVEGAASLPLLRPLLDRDKEEIIAEAQRLGTYEISILPDEDCCTLLAPRRAITWADPDSLVEIERRVDVETVVEELVGRARTMWPRLDGDETAAPALPVPA